MSGSHRPVIADDDTPNLIQRSIKTETTRVGYSYPVIMIKSKVVVDAVAVVSNKDINGISVAAPSHRMEEGRIDIAQELLKTRQTILEELR